MMQTAIREQANRTDLTHNREEGDVQPRSSQDRMSRRQLLILVAGVTAGAAGIGVPVIWNFVNQVRDLPLPSEHTGYLREDTQRTMIALTEAMFRDYPVELSLYEQYFTFHAEHIPGYRDLYDQFRVDMDRVAKQSYGLAFADCKIAPRRDVIAPWFFVPMSRVERVESAVMNGMPWLTYSHRIFREILILFMHTDAWLAAGYDSYPGTPRGLENYKIAIEPITI